MLAVDDVGDATRPGNAKTAADARGGVLSALVAYGAWGVMPLLFHFLGGVSSVDIVAHRTLWALVLVSLIVLIGGRIGEISLLLKDRRALRSIAISSVLLAGNWLLFVWAVEAGRVLEVSFGYFINPLVNIALGMVLLGERQNRWQMVSILIAAIAIGIQALGVGGVPYVALGLALSFGFYGYVRKTARVSSTTGLFAETVVIAPVALGYIVYSLMIEGTGALADPMTLFLLVLTGPGTALPLLLFAYAVRQLPLTTIGMFLYIAPSIQFLLAITFFNEQLNGVRLLSFGLIWLSLMVYSADIFWRRGRAAA
jgi:chloramphenicol-sensitive protein RarD